MTTARESLAQQLHELLKGSATPEGTAQVTELLDSFRVQAKAGTEVQPGVTARDSLGRAIATAWKRGPKDLERSVDIILDKYRMQLKKEGPPGADVPEEGPAGEPAGPVPAKTSKSAPAKPAPGGAEPAPLDGAAAPTVKAPKSAPKASKVSPKASPKAPKASPQAGTSAEGAEEAPRVAARGGAKAPPSPPEPQRAVPPPLSPTSPGRRPGLAPARSGPLSQPMAPRAAPQSVAPLFPGTPTGPSRRAECPKCKSRGVVLARTYAQEEYYSCIYCGWQAFKPFEEANPDAPLAARLLAQRPPQPKRPKSLAAEEDDDDGRERIQGSVITPDDEPAVPSFRPADGDDGAEAAEEDAVHTRPSILEDGDEDEDGLGLDGDEIGDGEGADEGPAH